MLSLLSLALGNFALGTGAFVIAGVLPQIGGDLGVDASQAALLMTVFALVYALFGPPLAAFTGGFDTKRLALWALGVYAVATAAAIVMPGYWSVLATRVLAGLGAALYTPLAAALAMASQPPERRGRALAFIAGGVSLSNVIGVPLGTWLGGAFGWRASFGLVAGLTALAALGLVLTLPANIMRAHLPLAALVRVALRGRVLATASVTVFWSASGFVVFAFIVPLLSGAAQADHQQISVILFLYGVASFGATSLSGRLIDRFGATSVVAWALPFAIATQLTMSLVFLLPPSTGLFVAGATMVVWGLAGWTVYPAQQARLYNVAPEAGALLLSINASALYFGISVGTTLGGVVLRLWSVEMLGYAAAAISLVGVALLAASARRPS